MVPSKRCSRRSARTHIGRRAVEVRRAVAAQIVQLRTDANVSQRQLSDAAGIPQSYLSTIERGQSEPSLSVLIAIGEALGADLAIRFHPGTGPRIRDRHQAPIVEALLGLAHPSWKRLVEVPVWRPVRGVIDAVLSQPGDLYVVTEVHSEIRRLEQQLRWATEKAEALPSAAAWTMLSGGDPSVAISRLLVLRSTKANRDLANS